MNNSVVPEGLFEVGNGKAYIKSEYLIADSDSLLSPDRTELETGNDEKVEPNESIERKRKRSKGQNKHRGPTFVQPKEAKLCSQLIDIDVSVSQSPVCTNPACTYMHNVEEYLKNKLPDLGDTCYIYALKGHCPWGITCRYGKNHVRDDGRNMKDHRKMESYTHPESHNPLSKELLISLRKKTYDFGLTNKAIKHYDEIKKCLSTVQNDVTFTPKSGYAEDFDCIPLRKEEMKPIIWKDKLYLAPMARVGNIPFRRICKEYGVDITCSEMVLSSSIISGTNEWALCKRHYTEDIFGIQIGGNNPYTLTKCFQVLQEQADVDFIDLNLGCPTEQICSNGSGCGLMMRKNVLQACLHSMSSVSQVPLTIKCRTGFHRDEKIVHKLLPMFVGSNASLITIHGRTKEQMYSKRSDWKYIEECAQSVTNKPVFGNGDILSYTDYNFIKEHYPNVSGTMIARGALYKPWIFTEIKEQRHWDISSAERMDILRKFVNYGLESWGSDTKGVENVRRFLLEWQSFLHRYIPVGLLEHPPQRINQRPPAFQGRNDLETLFASSNCQDWIRISEMLLGPVPPNFTYVPKHKSNYFAEITE